MTKATTKTGPFPPRRCWESDQPLASNRRQFEGMLHAAASRRQRGDYEWAKIALTHARRYAPHCPILP